MWCSFFQLINKGSTAKACPCEGGKAQAAFFEPVKNKAKEGRRKKKGVTCPFPFHFLRSFLLAYFSLFIFHSPFLTPHEFLTSPPPPQGYAFGALPLLQEIFHIHTVEVYSCFATIQ